MKPRRILCVFAHPDDESWLCGGVIAHCASRGDQVRLLTLTGGENATQLGPRLLSKTALKRIRTAEIRQAAKILGIARSSGLHFPDRGLKQVRLAKLVKVVNDAGRRFQPDFVLTFARDGATGHPDHQAVARTVEATIRRSPQSWAKECELLMFGLPNHVRRRFGLPAISPRKFQRFDVTRFAAKKIRAITTHRSQAVTLKRLSKLSGPERIALMRFEYVVVCYRSGRRGRSSIFA